jgi:ABC-type Fe3+-hydroxamate transport system substrate-binding protein
MELIYFILGFLSTATGYGIVLLTKTKSTHKLLLEELHSYGEISRKEFDIILSLNHKLKKDIDEVSEYYIGVQQKIETDAYEGNTQLNKRITELAELFNEQGNRNKRLFDMADKQLRQQQTEIQQANNTLKKIVDDPTILARY